MDLCAHWCYSAVVLPDEYLSGLLTKYAVNVAGAKAATQLLIPVLKAWGGPYLISTDFSGSLAKGTGVSLATDADLLLSMSSKRPGNLAQMYGSLWEAVTGAGYRAALQNVSIGTRVGVHKIDLVPARRQSQWGGDHSLFLSKSKSWTQTNVDTHIAHVTGSGRVDEIRLVKIWRERHKLDFSSFHLELATIDALSYARRGHLADNLRQALEHFRDYIQTARYVDPANTNNVVSDDTTPLEKSKIAAAASAALSKTYWEDIVW